MVIVCSAPGCLAKKSNISTKTSVQFHRFPLRKPDILAKWIKAMKCPNFKPVATSYLCSAHFTNSDYEIKSNSAGKQLKSNAVPTYFEKKRPGRKKKIIVENNDEESKIDSEQYIKVEESENMREEYLQVEEGEKIESNLAEIIGDRDKGTLQVLIVGEDGKITNSEYIFKKELVEDQDPKDESQIFFDSYNNSDEENGYDKKNLEDLKNNSSPDIAISDYSAFKFREKIKKLENNLDLALKKIKILSMKCRKANKQNKDLKILLKLLVLKRGRGEKNLKQLLEEYEGYEYDDVKIKVKEENLSAEN